MKHYIVIDTIHSPDVSLPREIPYALREKLKAELDKIVEMKMIRAVNKPKNWVIKIVLAEKPNESLRICIDPKELI